MHTLKMSLFILFFALSTLTGTSALAAKGKDPTPTALHGIARDLRQPPHSATDQ